MKITRAIVALLVVVAVLAGCSGAVPWNPQGYAGITHVDVQYEATRDKDGAVTGSHVARIRWWDGKEKQSIALDASIATGQVKYTAAGVAAFPAFATRADLEKAVSDAAKAAGVEIIPKVMDAIIKAIGPAVGLP